MGWRVRGDEDKFCWGTQPDSLQREGEASKWTVGWAVMQSVKAVCPGSCDGAALRMADSWKRMSAERVTTWWEVHRGAVLRGCFSCGGPWGPSRPSLVQEDERAFLASPHMPQGHSRVPVTSESYCAAHQSGMRVQEGMEEEAGSSMFLLINEPGPPSIASLH